MRMFDGGIHWRPRFSVSLVRVLVFFRIGHKRSRDNFPGGLAVESNAPEP